MFLSGIIGGCKLIRVVVIVIIWLNMLNMFRGNLVFIMWKFFICLIICFIWICVLVICFVCWLFVFENCFFVFKNGGIISFIFLWRRSFCILKFLLVKSVLLGEERLIILDFFISLLLFIEFFIVFEIKEIVLVGV